ncbi:MAG TPA: DsbA family oxidoreductase [Mesorhizobium sp.]|jgi:predicted DsbA family dithiol-disulfide isomerase|nr:DsbA family oxidoreductase [Mesorhizobium sp.]
MTANAERSLCTADGRAPGASGAAQSPRLATVFELNIVSDTICPWCFVGKRRIDRAIEELAAEGLAATTRWLPFELNPQMPAAGMDRRVYRSAKFGTWERSQALDAQVAVEGAREGIVFRHDLMERTPNTRASHRLIWLAGELGGATVQNRVVEGLFSAYFCEGRNVGEAGVLAEIGLAAGLPVEPIAALLAGDDGLAQVLQHEAWAASAGIQGVPSVRAGDLFLFSGALRTPLIVKALRKVALANRAAAVVREGEAGTDARA